MAENNTSRVDELHAKLEAMRKKYNLPPVKESMPITKTIKEINGVECEVTEYDNGYTMAVPVNNRTYEQKIETLIVETSFLAARYFKNYLDDDCQEIAKAFEAYFALIETSPEWDGMFHPEIIGNALLIIHTFQKFEDDIDDSKIRSSAFNTVYWLWDRIELFSLGLDVAMGDDPAAAVRFPDPFDRPDECRKAIRDDYRRYHAEFLERRKKER